MKCELCGYDADPLPIPHFLAGRWCDGVAEASPDSADGPLQPERTVGELKLGQATPTAPAPSQRPRVFVYGRLVTDDDVRSALLAAGDDEWIRYTRGEISHEEANRLTCRRMRQSIELRSRYR